MLTITSSGVLLAFFPLDLAMLLLDRALFSSGFKSDFGEAGGLVGFLYVEASSEARGCSKQTYTTAAARYDITRIPNDRIFWREELYREYILVTALFNFSGH